MDVAREVTESNPGSPLNYPINKAVACVDIPDDQSDIKSIRDNPHEFAVLVCKELFTKLLDLLVYTRVLSNPKSGWKAVKLENVFERKLVIQSINGILRN